ncbi:hypothetical protein STEG23_006699 [Scotinomys teguina]
MQSWAQLLFSSFSPFEFTCHGILWLTRGVGGVFVSVWLCVRMASLVAYDNSDSETEAEPARSVNSEDQADDGCGVTRPSRMAFASGTVDVTEEGVQHTERSPHEDPGDQHLPLPRIWSSLPGSCPSQRLQWPPKEPDTAFPTSELPCPSLWMSRAPAGHVPLAAACLKPVKPARDAAPSSSHTQSKVESTARNANSSQRKRAVGSSGESLSVALKRCPAWLNLMQGYMLKKALGSEHPSMDPPSVLDLLGQFPRLLWLLLLSPDTLSSLQVAKLQSLGVFKQYSWYQ